MHEWQGKWSWGRRLKNDLLFGIAATCLALLRRLPTRAVLALGPLIGWGAYWLAGRQRRRAHTNMRDMGAILPGDRRRKTVERSFTNLGRSAAEFVVLDRLRLRHADPKGAVRFSAGSRQVLEQALAGGRGVIFVSAHYGNWELMGAAVAKIAPVHVLARQSYDPRFTRLIGRFRRANGVNSIWIEQAGALRLALCALKRGAVLGILLDRAIPGGVPLSLLQRDMPITPLAAALARRTGAPIVAGFARRVGRVEHEITITCVEWSRCHSRRADIRAGTTACLGAVEDAIISDPCQWLWPLRLGSPSPR